MKMLALEFSSPRRSVAVLNAGGTCVCEVGEALPGNTMKPFAMIESVLQQAGIKREQIEGIAVGLGPGSYNGIRAAIALAQGWQLARGVKLTGLGSAECVAAQAQADGLTGRCGVVIDAQRGEFYLAGYEIHDGLAREVSPLRIVSADMVRDSERAGDILIGPEVTRWFPHGRIVFPTAAALMQLAPGREEFIPGEKLEPIYLRETAFVKAPPPRVISL